MRLKNSYLRWAIILLIAAILLAVVLHGGTSLAILVLFLVLFDIAACIRGPRFENRSLPRLAPVRPTLAPRPPPLS